jgi:Predicted hydrolases or acyltransferases (alpha/beta hydrolase superfamily)
MFKALLNLLFYSPLLCSAMPTTYKVEIFSGKVAYWDSKPQANLNEATLIFIHGHITNKRFFTAQFNSSVLNEYRIICIDLPGYGESDAPNSPERVYSWPGFAESVKEVIHVLGLQNYIIIGWSLGGHVGLELTSLLPHLKGLVITGTPPIEVSADGFSKGFKIVHPKILECFGKGNLSLEEIELLAKANGYDGSANKQFIKDAILQTDEGAKVIYPRSILNGVGQNELEIVANWSRPIAVIAGADEVLVNNEYIIKEVTFANLWNKQVHLVQDSGHFVHMEQPEIFNEIIHRFARDVFKNTRSISSKP